jgi:hypothetical protein
MQRFHEEARKHIDHEFTVYGRAVRAPGYPPITKWLASPMTNDCCAMYYTGIVHHVILDDDGSVWIGESRCSKRDTFNKKIGRAIAKGRAEKAYAQYWENNNHGGRDNSFKLKEIEILVGSFPRKTIQGYMCA